MNRKTLLTVSLACMGTIPAFANEPPVPKELYGSYAPAGDCTKQPKVSVRKEGVFIDSSAGKSGPLPVSVCYSCAGGARYEGIEIWVYVKYGKDKWGGDNMPVTLMFNAGEKRGALEITHDDTLRTPLGAPMTQLVKAKTLRQCRAAQ
ncbi:MAG: hypothetical protein E2598_00795 [Sphingobium sp.]|nr:hypothetical protein [Sphingobium sp.]